MKKQSDLSRLMGYAGNYRYFTYASWVLSAASALVALVPFVYIWKILRDVLNAAPDYAQAVNIPHSQREESIEGQIRECTAYAEKNGFTVVKHYIDRAVSAKTDNRPQFQQMIKDSERGIFDIIIVWKLDRFARNRYDSARYKTQLKRNGVKLVSATEVISAGPEGIILESVLEGYAEYYSADLSEKVVRGMTENALKGIYNGGTIPFGYMIDEIRHYQPDPLLAPYVEQTFQKYADGATMTDLRDWLKAHNIKNSMGGEMSYNTIQRMLSNRRYIGELRLRDVVQPNAIPALVSGELVGARPLYLATQDRSVA